MKKMVTLSLCMIVKNEELTLARCLESAKTIADEIIIVDTGSTDKTKEIAKTFTDKIYDFEWIDDFSAARNFSFSKASMDYQMWLDADDVLPPDTITCIHDLKSNLLVHTDADMVTMRYITHFDNAGNPTFESKRERLFKTSKNFKWEEPIHEVIPLVPNIIHSEAMIHHKKENFERTRDRNINIYLGLEAKRHTFNPRQLYYFARELQDHNQYAKAVYYYEKFLECGLGWKEDYIGSAFNLAYLYDQLGDYEKIPEMLTKTFIWDTPRPEICTRMGYYFKHKNDYAMALKWFDLAVNLPRDESILGFTPTDFVSYIPNLEACLCAYHLGLTERAIFYNEQAALARETQATTQNRIFFEGL